MIANDTRKSKFDLALSLARQSLYRFAAFALVDPKARTWEHLNNLRGDQLLNDAAKLIRSEGSASPQTLAVNERPHSNLCPDNVLAKLPDSESALNDEFEKTFGLIVSAACPPYETEYIDGKLSFQRSQTLGDIGGFYRAFGMQPSDVMPERHDHIVLELEFMALLIGLERQAIETGELDAEEKALVCHDAQRRFLDEHLAWWAPAFGKLLGKENRGRFYEAVGVFLAAFIPTERALLKVDPPLLDATPSTLERPEECDGCLLKQ